MMGAPVRFTVVALVLAALVLATGAQAEPAAAGGAQGPAHAAPVAEFSLGGLFGDENEPDENEPDEGTPSDQQSQDRGAGVSIPVMLLLVAAAAALGGFVYVRVRRLYLRLVAWGRGLWARL
jgi:hypothetical protein